jgi:hypothetical protein
MYYFHERAPTINLVQLEVLFAVGGLIRTTNRYSRLMHVIGSDLNPIQPLWITLNLEFLVEELRF